MGKFRLLDFLSRKGKKQAANETSETKLEIDEIKDKKNPPASFDDLRDHAFDKFLNLEEPKDEKADEKIPLELEESKEKREELDIKESEEVTEKTKETPELSVEKVEELEKSQETIEKPGVEELPDEEIVDEEKRKEKKEELLAELTHPYEKLPTVEISSDKADGKWSTSIQEKIETEELEVIESKEKSSKISLFETAKASVPFLRKQEKEKKNPKLDPKVKWVLIRRLGGLFFICGLVIAGALYSISPLNQLQKVNVTGNQRIPTDWIKREAGFKLGDSLWPQVMKKEKMAEKILKNNIELKSVHITFAPWNHLDIKVEEYQIDGLFKEGQKYYPILENGKILKNQESGLQGDLPVLVDFKDPKIIQEFLDVYHQLPQTIVQLIEEIHYTGNEKHPKQLTLTMSDGNQVITRISTLTSYLPKYPQVAALMKENGVVDMEAGIYSYPYGNDEKAPEKDKEKEKDKTEEKTETNLEKKTDENVSQNKEKEKDKEENPTFIQDITQLPPQNGNQQG